MPLVHSDRSAPVVSIDSGQHRARFLARRDALVEDHLHLVLPIARKIAAKLPPSFDVDDLIATGHLALLHIATKYRPKEHGGAPFSAYARKRICGAIIDSIRRRHYEENTRPSIEDAPEPSYDPRIQINTSFDDRRLRARLVRAIDDLPERPTSSTGKVISFAEKLAELHEWRAARDHVDAIAIIRRGLRAA